MPANELNETTILDNEELNFGTSKDLKIVFDSADNRVELRDTSDVVVGYITLTGGFGIDNLLVGGGYGSTGATISSAGVIQTNGAFTTDGACTADSVVVGGGYGSTGVTISNTGNISANGNLIVGGIVRDIATTATIATGAIAVTSSFVYVDTEAAAGTDDLDTINGGSDGMRLTLVSTDSGRDIVIKDSTGNIECGGDKTLGTTNDTISFIFRGGSGWKMTSNGIGN